MLKMRVEGGYQRVPFGIGSTDRLAYRMLFAKQRENFCQPAPCGTKLALLPPTRAGSVTRQRGFVCCCDR